MVPHPNHVCFRRSQHGTLTDIFGKKMLDENVQIGLTFDDVLLLPAKSEVLPKEVDISTKLTRNISINIPVVSAAMDTVTEAELAMAMAREGGIGFIHRAMSPDRQKTEIDRVKKSESGMILDPITIPPEALISEAMSLMEKYRISGVPVTEKGKLIGIITNRDLRFETQFSKKVSQVMTREKLITAVCGNDTRQGEKPSP